MFAIISRHEKACLLSTSTFASTRCPSPQRGLAIAGAQGVWRYNWRSGLRLLVVKEVTSSLRALQNGRQYACSQYQGNDHEEGDGRNEGEEQGETGDEAPTRACVRE